MKIDCLMGTYGRYGLACEALACFLQQTKLSDATLLIYNQHPRPLSFDHPRVRVVNESGGLGSLRQIRERMHELADPAAELLHWWDDDDLYLPWHLDDCIDNIGESVAWKPESAWYLDQGQYVRHKNRFEASWVFRAEYLKTAPIDTHPAYSDHPVTLQTEDGGLLATTELGDNTSYIYRWNTGGEHLSTYFRQGREDEQHANLARYRKRSRDIGYDGVMVATDLSQRVAALSRRDQTESRAGRLEAQPVAAATAFIIKFNGRPSDPRDRRGRASCSRRHIDRRYKAAGP